jgi:AraC-like DNA-binding protein
MLIFLIVVSALVLGKASYMDNVILVILGCVLLAFLLSMLAFVCTVGDVERHSIPGILRLVRFGNIQSEAYISEPESSQDNEDGKQSVGGQGFVIPEQAGGITSNESDEMSQTVKAMLESKFENHVKEGNLFLKRELSVQAVADDLKVSRAELIHYLDMVYGMSFQSYINMLRVEYAEQYLISHDDVTQKEIARVCGFSSASAFNTAFSRLTGVTPKIWKDRYLEMNRKENAASDI